MTDLVNWFNAQSDISQIAILVIAGLIILKVLD